MKYSRELNEVLDMLEQLSLIPGAIEKIAQSNQFIDFRIMLEVHLEDLEK